MKEPRLFHVGIAVDDIEIATSFFQRVFNFELVQSRTVSHSYLGELVGSPEIQAKINMLTIDDHNLMEILEWSSPHFHSPESVDGRRIYESRAQHLCLYTNDAEVVFSKLKLEEVEFISETPVTIELGPNKGAKVFFIKVFGFLYIEIFQKPPHLQ
jgi:catechol 2,3-dioxygenase-like lactoylglutathione lyase family enzyme